MAAFVHMAKIALIVWGLDLLAIGVLLVILFARKRKS